MASITTRETGTTGTGGVTRKNLPLSNAEIDNNFLALNTAKLEITDTTESNTSGAVVKRDASTSGFAAGPVQLTSLGIGTAASGTTGEIRATNTVTSYYSDERLKTRLGNIENALEKVLSLDGFHYRANETAVSLGYDSNIAQVGLSAQQVQIVMPEVVVPAPIDEQYLTIHYERLVPLLVEAIKELKMEVDKLNGR
jgi:hypothetical protein